MTPLEALVKNILTIGLLILPITLFKDQLETTKKINPILITGLSASLLMFILLPQGSSIVSGSNTKSKASIYTKYFDDIAQGNKLLCFFSPTCEHCMETGKQITALSKKYPGLIPEVRILFMDESDNGSEKEIKDYFNFIGKEYNYKVLSIEDFVPLFWGEKDFPGVMYLYEGKERIFFDGNGENEFNMSKLLQEIKREY